ncbi:hypothetical protein K492DRAFT_239649 [Lichtheimia hyalospora FSU 10163]|nr:hypothetical protein K492DRAFT_239649 [Lichtheimia hyalospora FSU 10163]
MTFSTPIHPVYAASIEARKGLPSLKSLGGHGGQHGFSFSFAVDQGVYITDQYFDGEADAGPSTVASSSTHAIADSDTKVNSLSSEEEILAYLQRKYPESSFRSLMPVAKRSQYLPSKVSKYCYVSNTGAVFSPYQCRILEKKIDKDWYHYVEYPYWSELQPLVFKGESYKDLRISADGWIYRRQKTRRWAPMTKLVIKQGCSRYEYRVNTKRFTSDIHIATALLESYNGVKNISPNLICYRDFLRKNHVLSNLYYANDKKSRAEYYIQQLHECYPEEKWIPLNLPKYPFLKGSYLVSDQGRIFSLTNIVFKETSYKSTLDPVLAYGYVCLIVNEDGNKKTFGVHRLVMISFGGDQPGKDVDHKNKKRQDNRLSNLRWATRSENLYFKAMVPTPFDPVDHSVQIPDLSTQTWQSLGNHVDGRDFSDYEVCELGFIRKKATKDLVHHFKDDNGYVFSKFC